MVRRVRRGASMSTDHARQSRAVRLDLENDKGSLPWWTDSLLGVGVPGFEPGASTSRTWRATKLRYTPKGVLTCSLTGVERSARDTAADSCALAADET